MDADCMYDACMSETIQVRNVPKKVHAELVRRAKVEGLSLNKYLLGEFERMTRRSSHNAELLRLAHSLPGKRPTTEEIVRAIREVRDDPDSARD